MAGLIPQSFIDDLLSRVDIVDVVSAHVTLKKTGKNYSGLCPFHQEKTPSFTVEPDKQFYYCFGCGAGGNALGFVMNYENLDFPRAIESLARGLGLEVPREESEGQRHRREQHHQLYDIMQEAEHFFQAQLRRHPARDRAVDYLKRRGVTGEAARDFGLGYAPPGWDNLLAAVGTTEARRKQLLDAGMLIEKPDNRRHPFHDRFRDRIMFPIRDNRGRVIAFGGRVLGDDNPKYLNSPETSLYHKSEELYGLYEARRRVRKLERILIVEGYMDVLALAQSGIPWCVATLGTATTSAHLRRLFRLVGEVVFCFDGDDAGREAAWRALQQALPLMEDGRSARFLFLPRGEDPDSQVRGHGPDAFLASVEEAPHLGEFFFQALQERTEIESLEGKAALARLAMPLIRQLPQGVYRQLILDQLSRLTGADPQTLGRMSRPPTPREPGPPPDRPVPPPPDRPGAAGGPHSLCMKAVNLLLLNPGIIQDMEIDETLWEVEAPDIELLRQVIELAGQYPGSTTPELMGRLYATPQGSRFTRLLDREQITPSEGAEREFRDILHHLLERHRLRQRRESLLAQARRKLASRRGQGGDGEAEGPAG